MVYYYEVMCPVEKLVHFLLFEGHSEGIYNQNMTIFTISSKLLVRKLRFIVQHHKLEWPVEKWDFYVEGQGHSESSKCE